MMESSFTILRLRGIPIGAHWSWLFIFTIVFWSLATALFPSTYPGLDGSTYLVMGVAAAVLFFASVLLHELGHAFRALDEGLPIEGITLWLFGGVARLRGMPRGPGAEFRVAIAGPLVTVVLTALFGAAAYLGDVFDLSGSVRGVVDYLTRINAAVLGFNLIPALPLDGGRVLRAWLWRRQGSLAAATRSAARAGQAFGATLIAIGLLGLVTGSGLGGIWMAFIGWFLVQAAQSESTAVMMRQTLSGLRVRDVMATEPTVVPPHLTVAEFLELARSRRFSHYPVVDDGRLVGLMSLRAAASVPGGDQGRRRVGDVMVPHEATPVVDPDQEVAEALSSLGSEPARAMVVSDGRLVGILSRSDVARAVELAQARPPAPEPTRGAGAVVWVVVGSAVVVAASALYHPPFAVVAPGEAIDVVGDVEIDGVPVDDVSGRYLLTSVQLSRPSALRTVIAAVRADRQVVALSSVVPRGVDAEEYFRSQRAVFEESRLMAAAAAARVQGLPVSVTGTGARVVEVLPGSAAAEHLRRGDVIVEVDGQDVNDAKSLREIIQSRPAGTEFRIVAERGDERVERLVASRRLPDLSGGVGIGVVIDTRGLEVDLPFEVTFRRRDVGGPSAGLAYALAIADKLTPADEARGRTVAATGTIDVSGEVGPVGGVEQKAVAAHEAGATIFLVPAAEVEEVDRSELRVEGVTSLQRAMTALGGG